jgi:hypothetical protein
MKEIEHKIGITVKNDCQVTISPLLQHMLGIKRAIFPHGDHVADVFRGVNYLYVYCPRGIKRKAPLYPETTVFFI